MADGAHARLERTRRTILAAAEELFLKHGLLGISMDQIAEAAVVSKQTVYAHFQSKEALFLEVVNTLTGAAGDQLQVSVADPPIEHKLEVYLLDFARQQLTIVLTPKLMQVRRLVIGELGRFPELGRALYKMGPGRSISRLERVFRHYRDARELVVVDLNEAASNFNWLIMGGPVNDAMMLGDEAIPGRERLEQHAVECVRVFIAAYGVPAKN